MTMEGRGTVCQMPLPQVKGGRGLLLLLALPWASGEKALPSAKVLGDRQGLCMMLSGSEEDTSVHGPS